MGVMIVRSYYADTYVRRVLFPLVVGALLGLGLSLLPSPFDLIAVLGFALFGLGYCVWALIDTRRALRRLEERTRLGAAYIASHDRHRRA